jgi:predicted Zn-dependent peptidase
MTVAVAGNVDHAAVVRMVRKAFSRRDFLADVDARPMPPRLADTPRSTKPGDIRTSRAFEQVNIVLGMRGLTRSDDKRYALGVLNAAFGGGSSSRLFQEVREHRGLAYSVYSFATSYSDAGMVGVSAGSLPTKSDELLDVVRAELARVVESGLTQEELDRGRGQMRGGLVLSLEDTGSRMTRLGEVELFQDRLLSLDEVLARLDAVTLDDVNSLAAELFSRPETLAVVGPA